MRKIYIRTSDIFDYKDAEKRMKHFDFCRKKALECGLICRSHIDGMNTRLFIEGRKSKMVRYYLATIFKTGDGANGVKRLISIFLLIRGKRVLTRALSFIFSRKKQLL